MLYPPSPALRTFKVRRKEVFSLLRNIKRANKTMSSMSSVAPPIIRAAIVLLYSHLEGYVENLVEDAISVLNGSGVHVSQLPRSLRVAQGMAELHEIMNRADVEKRDELMGLVFAKNYPLWDNSTLPPATLDAELFTRDFANPSVGHIDKLFGIFGVNKPFSSFHSLGFSGRRVGRIMPDLDALAQLRHDIAHGNFSTTISYGDFVGYLRTINDLCKCLDARMGLTVEQIIGAFPWC